MVSFALLLALLLGSDSSAPQARRPPAAPFQTPLSMSEMTNRQAVVHTSLGQFVIDLKPDVAPNHVGYFIEQARKGAFDKTVFHRVVRHGIIQGGDPLSKDPAKVKAYGTGGLGVLKAEFNAEPATRGAVAAVLQPNKPDSAGAQFFVCITDQPALSGKYTVFGRVSEGMDVAQRISEVAASPEGLPESRIEIVSVTIRDTPPPEPEPFSIETPEQLAQYRAVIDTSAGTITVELFPEKAPGHVRNFLRLAQAGVYDGMLVHRVVRGFAIQTGSLAHRGPLAEKQQKLVRTLLPEFNDTRHVKGVLSMARGDDPASASTSFFIVTGDASSLDGKYTAFGRVVEGLGVVEAIEQTPVQGETPISPIQVRTVRVDKRM
jgi:peptidyl-prolyl cis-trans isomerase B (cyclophilin B)